MNTLIPIEYYTNIYYYFFLVICLYTFITSQHYSIDDIHNLKVKKNLTYLIFLFVVIYIGTRPLSGKYFGDMRTYADTYERYSTGIDDVEKNDFLFDLLMQGCSTIMPVEFFFLICTCLYVIPLMYATKSFFSEYQFYGFLMLVISMSFWSYGTNGLRNGIATSIFILALSRKKIINALFWILVSTQFHKSLTVPALIFIVTYFYNNSKTFFYVWLAAIPLSLVLGGFWENFFLNIGLFDDNNHLEGYLVLDDEFQAQFSKVGFRWDFLLYSAIGVFSAWYYIVKKDYIEDQLYVKMCNIYLLANAIWILVIRANFSNRFAYLSWFLLGLIIIYPLLKYKFFKNQHQVVGRIVFIYFMFTFLMNVILA